MEAMTQQAISNYLKGLSLTWKEEIEHKSVSYFAPNSKEFYKHGIYKLVGKWMVFLKLC